MPRNRMFKPSFARPLAPQSAHRIHKNFIGINAFCFLLKYFNHANILNFLPSAKPAKTQTGMRIAQKIKPVSTLPKNAAGICSKPDAPYSAPSPPKKTENKTIKIPAPMPTICEKIELILVNQNFAKTDEANPEPYP